MTETQKKYLPIIVAIVLFMQILDATILNTALPAMAKDLHQPVLSMQWAVISYTLTLAILTPISGFIADKYGTKTTFMVAVSIFTLGSLMCALSPTLNSLIFSRVVKGLGGALMMPVAKLTLIKSYPREQMLSIMNYAVMPALIGPVIGPLVGGYLVELASWHWIFLISVPIGVIGLWAGYQLMPNYVEKNANMDLLGFLLFGGSMASFTFALEFANNIDVNNPSSIVFTLLVAVVAVILLMGYYLHAKYVESRNGQKPLFGLDLFCIRTFRVGIFGNLLTRLGMSAVPLLAFMGACNSLQFSAMNSISIAKLRREQKSSGNSLLSVNQQLAMSFGIGLSAMLLHMLTPARASLAQTQQAFSMAFVILGLMTILSGLYFLKLHKIDGRGMYQ